MKKIINGKMYNTETAKELGTWDNGLYCNDFYWCEETLYRKRTGEYFLFGESGANGKYGEYIEGKMHRGGYGIIPCTEREAKQWAEEKLTADEYISIFGEVEE